MRGQDLGDDAGAAGDIKNAPGWRLADGLCETSQNRLGMESGRPRHPFGLAGEFLTDSLAVPIIHRHDFARV